MVTDVTVNYCERNFFGDYDELRHDTMAWAEPDKVCRAIDRQVRMHRSGNDTAVLFVTTDTNEQYRLMYDYASDLSRKVYRIRHYTNATTHSWEHDEPISPNKAKALVRDLFDR